MASRTTELVPSAPMRNPAFSLKDPALGDCSCSSQDGDELEGPEEVSGSESDTAVQLISKYTVMD